MNTKIVEQFEALDTELLACVKGGQAMPPLHGGGGITYHAGDDRDNYKPFHIRRP